MVSTMMRAEYATGMPAYLIETGYEHVPWYTSSDEQRRQQAWEAILNGGTGQNFGNGWLWPFGTPDVTGGIHDWRTQLATASANDMGRLAAFFGSRRVRPGSRHRRDLPHRGARFADVVRQRRAHRQRAAGRRYLPSSRTLTINMADLAGTVTARWFDRPPAAARQSAALPPPVRAPSRRAARATRCWCSVPQARSGPSAPSRAAGVTRRGAPPLGTGGREVSGALTRSDCGGDALGFQLVRQSPRRSGPAPPGRLARSR